MTRKTVSADSGEALPSQRQKLKTKQSSRRVLSTGLLAIIGLASTPLIAYAAPKLVFKETFDKGFRGDWEEELCCSHSATTVSSPSRYKDPGSRAAKFTLKKGEAERSEVRLDPVPANSEYTYRFSMFLPDDYVADSTFDIVGQWHEVPDWHLGEDYRTPPLSLITSQGEWHIHNRWDSKSLTRDNTPEGTKTFVVGNYKKGQWTDWKIQVKWSHTSNGLLEVWKDGKLVVRKRGPNTYNDRSGPYFKMGIYKPRMEESKLSQRTLYFDALRIYQHQ